MNSSRLLDKAVDQFASLPGVGRKTALKFVLHLLKKDVQEVDDFLKSIGDLKKNIKECRRCHNISDGEICEICSDPKRDNTTLCVVENIKDILSIEATSQYNGLYHVLGGIISPMDGIGPADLHITSLVERVEQEPIREIIFALSATIEGDTTGYYIFKKMKNTALFVNVGRGPIVDTDALINALKTGEIDYAALDVTDPEPLPADHPLLDVENCLIVPHIGSYTDRTRYDMSILTADNIIAGVHKKPLKTCVNEEVNYKKPEMDVESALEELKKAGIDLADFD